MLAYAIDNPAPSTIILITGDRDFAYALSILKHRRYQVVLVTLSNAHASLVHQACIRFDWYNDVINQLDASNSQVSKESRYVLANDVYESDYLYSPKEVETVVYPTRNTRGTHSPSKNSRNIPLQSSLSSRLSTSQYRLNESNMRYAEDQTTMDVSSPSKPNRPRDRLPRFPTIEDSQGAFVHINHCPRRQLVAPDQERDRFIPSSNKSLIGRIEHTPSSPSSRTSSPFASVENESDHELERKKPMIIPTMYVFLVRILQGHRRKGITHSYRSVIASKMAHEQATYRRAGVNTFAEFMELADRNGIVELGGNGKDAWVRLLSDWYDAVPF